MNADEMNHFLPVSKVPDAPAAKSAEPAALVCSVNWLPGESSKALPPQIWRVLFGDRIRVMATGAENFQN